MSRAEQRQTVEYRTVQVGRNTEERLNELAEEGWRVVERIDVESGTWKLVMERVAGGGRRE